MKEWLRALTARLDAGPVAVVTVLSAEGSTPRETGARMLVMADTSEGTIGGGALEFAAIAEARAQLVSTEAWQRRVMDVPLGPALQQCCGGFVRLLIEVVRAQEKALIAEGNKARNGFLVRPAVSGPAWVHVSDRRRLDALPLAVAKAVREMMTGCGPVRTMHVDDGATAWLIEPLRPPRTKLFLYGAGHVAREIVAVLDGLAYDITWIDVAPSRFPVAVRPDVAVVVAHDPVEIARASPAGSFHVVMTFSHAIDEQITAALLEANTFAYLGLIGSNTKRARFIQRFRRAGIAEAAIGRLTCPIGLSSVPGKEPRAIAIALAAELLQVSAALQEDSASNSTRAGCVLP